MRRFAAFQAVLCAACVLSAASFVSADAGSCPPGFTSVGTECVLPSVSCPSGSSFEFESVMCVTFCGDGELDEGEECDDGNTMDGDGCSSTCNYEEPDPYCGDGAVNQAFEECDDGNTMDGDGCSATCKQEGQAPYCGDGVVNQASEECDDGNTMNGDGCSATCKQEGQAPYCGDGVVNQASEECDDGNTMDGDGCSSTCASEGADPYCGDGKINQAFEECDDGNTSDGDGCSSDCEFEDCPDGFFTLGKSCLLSSVQCADGEWFSLQSLQCQAQRCGDGIVSDDEECDDGNTNDNDGCSSSCLDEYCGDGIVNGQEDCDGTSDCTSDCLFEDTDECPDDDSKTTPGVCGCGTSDVDTDNDGTPDCNDKCPNDDSKTEVGVCGCGTSDVDTDNDGTPDCNDKCPNDVNKTDTGACGCGVADDDADSDGTADCEDACPNDPAKSSSRGSCGCGNPETDADNDGFADCVDDCPADPAKSKPGVCGCNVTEATSDSDSDNVIDCFDGCPHDASKTVPGICGCGTSDDDTDGDGVSDCDDRCPNNKDKSTQADFDVCNSCTIAIADVNNNNITDCLEDDQCPGDPNKLTPGICGCGTADDDTDQDGVADCNDLCPNDPDKAAPGACGCGNVDTDSDQDGTADCNDACPNDAKKSNSSGICGCGTAETDSDQDGVPDCNDVCPLNPELNVALGVCNCSTIDSDNDGTFDCVDECPFTANKTLRGECGCNKPETDTDQDGAKDCNDACPFHAIKTDPGLCGCNVTDQDSDLDGTVDCRDGCPNDFYKTSPGACGCGSDDTDTDSDGTADCNDGCPNDPDKTAAGDCGCGVADTDSDGDGHADCNEVCITDPRKQDKGVCGCGVADTDTDDDGTPDCNDACINDKAKVDVGECGCGVAETDSDSDGTPDCVDQCPNNDIKTEAGVCGCAVADTDSDGDGVPDCIDDCNSNLDRDQDNVNDCDDECPDDPNKSVKGACGCGVADTDSDSDLTPDCFDQCPFSDLKTASGVCGCDVADSDRDNDGFMDCVDGCPDDKFKQALGTCGCGVPDDDKDGDGVKDCLEDCPADANKVDPGRCGCGVADTDSDVDGVPDCNDDCPADEDKTAPGVCGCGVVDAGKVESTVWKDACSAACNDATGCGCSRACVLDCPGASVEAGGQCREYAPCPVGYKSDGSTCVLSGIACAAGKTWVSWEAACLALCDSGYRRVASSGTSTCYAASPDTCAVGTFYSAAKDLCVPKPAALVISTETTTVAEAGSAATYTVVLDTQPSSFVFVVLMASDSRMNINGLGGTSYLMFTPSDWATPQTVSLLVDNNDLVDGEKVAGVSHTVASTDTRYAVLEAKELSVTITDTDAASVLFTASDAVTVVSQVTVKEGKSTEVGIRLGAQPTSSVRVMAAGITSGSTTTYANNIPPTFTPANWDVAQMVTISVNNDDRAIAGGVMSLEQKFSVLSSDTDFSSLASPALQVSVQDNDQASASISSTTSVLKEAGAAAAFTFTLGTNPFGPIMVAAAVNSTRVTVSPSSFEVNSTNYATGVAVTVTPAARDFVATGTVLPHLSFSVSPTTVDGAYQGLAAVSAAMRVLDIDTAGFVTSIDGVAVGGLTLADSEAKVLNISLRSKPTANVDLSVVSLGASSLSVETVDTLSWTPATWDSPLRVRLVGGSVGSSVDVTVAYRPTSTDAGYSTEATFPTTVVPNTAFVRVSNPILELTEGIVNVSKSYTLTPSVSPSGALVVSLEVVPNDLGLTLSTSSVSWAATQQDARTVTVTFPRDDSSRDVQAAIRYTVSTFPAEFSSSTNMPETVVKVANIDSPGAVANQTVFAVTESGSEVYSQQITLASRPTSTVTVTATPMGDNAGLVQVVAPISISPSEWNTGATLQFKAGNDNKVLGMTSVPVSYSFSSSDSQYLGASYIENVVVHVVDDDVSAVTLAVSGSSQIAEGTEASMVLSTSTEPTASFDMLVKVDARLEVLTTCGGSLTSGLVWNSTTRVATITMTPGAAMGGVTFCVQAVVNRIDEGDNSVPQTSLVIASAAPGSAATEYDGLADSASIGVLDRDTASLTVTPTTTTSVKEGEAVSYTVSIGTQPTGVVTVVVNAPSGHCVQGTSPFGTHTLTGCSSDAECTDNLDSGRGWYCRTGTETSASTQAVVFTAANWESAQTVVVTAVTDDLMEPAPTESTISFSAAGSGDAIYAALSTTQSMTITDTTENRLSASEFLTSTGTMVVEEGGATVEVTIALLAEPFGDLPVKLNVLDGQITATFADGSDTHTFNAANWNVPTTVRLTAVDDEIDETKPHASAFVATPSAPAGSPFLVVQQQTLSVSVRDNDWSGVEVRVRKVGKVCHASPEYFSVLCYVSESWPNMPFVCMCATLPTSGVFLSEGATVTDVVSMRLTSQPTASVSVSLNIPDDTVQQVNTNTCTAYGATPSGTPVSHKQAEHSGALTFGAANWNTWQDITMTAALDSQLEGTTTTTVSVVSASTDTNYDTSGGFFRSTCGDGSGYSASVDVSVAGAAADPAAANGKQVLYGAVSMAGNCPRRAPPTFTAAVVDTLMGPPPQPTSVAFTQGLGAIAIIFDVNQVSFGATGVFDCETYLGYSGLPADQVVSCDPATGSVASGFGADAYCVASGNQIVIGLSQGFAVRPGHTITLRPNFVRKLQGAESNAGLRLTLATPPAQVPTVSISGPNEIGSCDDVLLTADIQGWSGTLTYVWGLQSATAANGTAVAASVALQTFLAGSSAQLVYVDGTLLQAGITYTFSLSVQSIFYPAWPAANATIAVAKVQNSIPTIIVAGGDRTVSAAGDNWLKAFVYTCGGRDYTTMETFWFETSGVVNVTAAGWRDTGRVDPTGAGRPVLKNLANNQRNLRIWVNGASPLTPGKTYTFQVLVVLDGNVARSSQRSVSVKTREEPLVATLDWPTSMSTFKRTDALVVSAAGSQDPNDASLTLSMTWECVLLATTATGAVTESTFCPFSIPAAVAKVLTFPSGHIPDDLRFRLKLSVGTTYLKADGTSGTRSAATSADFHSVTDAPVVRVVLSEQPGTPAASTKVIASQTVAMTAYVDGAVGIPGTVDGVTTTFSWQQIQGDLPAAVFTNGGNSSVFGTTLTVAGLDIKPFQLTSQQPEVSYGFRVTVARGSASSTAEAFFTVNAAPQGGSVSTFPLNGTAITTTFTISTFGWYDDAADLPLMYDFGFDTARSPAQITASGLSSSAGALTLEPVQESRVRATLPQGSTARGNKISVVVTAFDNLGASSMAMLEVEVSRGAELRRGVGRDRQPVQHHVCVAAQRRRPGRDHRHAVQQRRAVKRGVAGAPPSPRVRRGWRQRSLPGHRGAAEHPRGGAGRPHCLRRPVGDHAVVLVHPARHAARELRVPRRAVRLLHDQGPGLPGAHPGDVPQQLVCGVGRGCPGRGGDRRPPVRVPPPNRRRRQLLRQARLCDVPQGRPGRAVEALRRHPHRRLVAVCRGLHHHRGGHLPRLRPDPGRALAAAGHLRLRGLPQRVCARRGRRRGRRRHHRRRVLPRHRGV